MARADFFVDQTEQHRHDQPRIRKPSITGSTMNTMSHEYHFSENGQKGRTP